MALGTYRPLYGQTKIVQLKATSTAINEGEICKTVTAMVKAGDSSTVGAVGIAAANIAASGTGPFYLDGVFVAPLVGTPALAPGDLVYSATDGVDDGSMSDKSIGYVVDVDPPATAGTPVTFLFTSSLLCPLTTHA